MPAPKSATGRIVVPVSFSGHLSHFHAYVRNIQAGGTDYRINSRATDANDLEWQDAAEGLYESLSYLWASGISAGSMSLEKKVGTMWVPLSFVAPSADHVSGSGHPASQVTMTLRDKLFYKVKVVVLNTKQIPPYP